MIYGQSVSVTFVDDNVIVNEDPVRVISTNGGCCASVVLEY